MTQTIITNGQYYSFYAYQMNTCALYYKHAGSINPHKNVCFVNDEMKLYDMIENGQVKGKDIFNWKTFYVDEFSNSMLGFFSKDLTKMS